MMYDYTIYWIKPEIANHYFLKSDILQRFFEEYQYNQHRIDLRKQFSYITNDFRKEKIITTLQNHLNDHIDIHPSGSIIRIQKNNSDIMLHISTREITFQTKSLQDAEAVLFPILRLIHPLLFIVGNTNDDYGWISPIKIPRENIRNQVLYSCQ